MTRIRRLFVTFAAIGDLVMITPLIRRLAADGPLTVLGRPYAGGLLAGQPWLAASVCLRKPHRGSSLLGEWWFGGERRALADRLTGTFDEVVRMRNESPAIDRLIERIAKGAPVRTVALRFGVRDEHLVDRIRPALEAAGFPCPEFDPLPRIIPDPAQVEWARSELAQFGRRVVGIVPGSSQTAGRWQWRPPVNLKSPTPQQWAALLGELLSSGRADAVVAHGTAPESALAQAIAALIPKAFHDRFHDRCGDFPLSKPLARQAAVFAAEHAVIAVDTGPGHLAAAAGARLVSLYGPTNPRECGPRGPGRIEVVLGQAPCQYCIGTARWRTCTKNVCLQNVSLSTLLTAYDRVVG
jgi:ADP-heptose:LPS heptosyltransferase